MNEAERSRTDRPYHGVHGLRLQLQAPFQKMQEAIVPKEQRDRVQSCGRTNAVLRKQNGRGAGAGMHP